MKLRSLEQLNVSDVIPANFHNMRFAAVHDIFATKVYLVWEFRKRFIAFLGSFFVFVSFTLETVTYDQQKCQVVRRFTAVTQLERLLAKHHNFNSLIQKLRGSEQKYGLRTLVLGIT